MGGGRRERRGDGESNQVGQRYVTDGNNRGLI